MVAQPVNRMADQFREAMERPAEMVKDHPLPSMLLMFGVGIGVGVLLSQTVCSTLMEAIEEPTMTEKMKRQVFDALSHVMSPSMYKQFQQYAQHYTS
jgi:hypothetical protein